MIAGLLVAYLSALLAVTRRERQRADVGTLYSPRVQSFVRHDTRLVEPSAMMEPRRVAR